MANSRIISLVLLLACIAVSIYVLVTSTNLSIPISLGTRLTILLPFIAAANVHLAPVLQRMSRNRKNPALVFLLPFALQIIQGILTVVIATLSFEGVLPGANLDCSLHNVWQQLWRSHDSRAIERIQDAYNCCGLVSVRDMSEPHRGTDTNLCSAMYHRSSPCLEPWRGATQRNSGLEFAVAVAIGIFQLAHLAMLRSNPGSGSGSSSSRRALVQGNGVDSSDRLLGNGRVEEETSPEAEDESNGRVQGYGTVEDEESPRVQPSGLGDEGHQWR